MAKLTYQQLDRCSAFAKLREMPAVQVCNELDPDRIARYELPAGGGLTFNYAARPVNERIIEGLNQLCAEQELREQFQALHEGAVMNVGEQRMVLHHLVRGRLGSDVFVNGRSQRDFYVEQQERAAVFAHGVRAGSIKGSTGKQFQTVVQIGIGGSDLGPRALYLALKRYCEAHAPSELDEEADSPSPSSSSRSPDPTLEARFISNVDPDDAAAVLAGLDPERTLFILVSKSGTTQETLTNEHLAIDWMKRNGPRSIRPRKHMVCVTAEGSPLAASDEYLDAFFIDDYIGGRYSGTSAVGGALLSLAFGPEAFSQVLEGAHEADKAATAPFAENAAMIDAAIGVYERNVLGYPSTAVLPYSQALERFPAHLQQLDMESNGKRVDREGTPVRYPTGPLVFGEPGTNGQHSFYQLLHQGTDIVPLQFIGFRRNQSSLDIEVQGSTSREKLNANLAAQVVAFAAGKADDDANKHFPGNRPGSLIYGEELNPRSLGALLAHFENKVMFQGFLWNINSFDQEGVQLGKVLTKQLLGGGERSALLAAYADILGV